jgi:histidine triad (HIT) family protein
MTDSIFTKIIRGDIPCHKIYEDDRTFAFLDIHPLHQGHTLVIPKNQIEFVWDLSDEDYQAVMATSKKVAHRLRQVLPYSYIAQRVIGVDVPHAHVHLIPFDTVDQLQQPQRFDIDPDHSALADLAAKLSF